MTSNDFERVKNKRYNARTTNEIINHWHPRNVSDCRAARREASAWESARSTYVRVCRRNSCEKWQQRRAARRREVAYEYVTRGSCARKQDHVEEGFREVTGFRPDGSIHKGFINFPGPWKFTPLPVRELLPRSSSRLRAKWIDRTEVHKSRDATE